jgi:phosphatidate cytidylyltransferase
LLRTRIITALILAPLVISAIYLLPLSLYAGFFWLLTAAGAYEWAGLSGLSSRAGQLAYVAVFGLLAIVAWRFPGLWSLVLWLGVIFWALAAVAVIAYPTGGHWAVHPAFSAPAGLVVVWAGWLALVVIREQPGGATWVLWLMFLVWSADIGAYFAGRQFGRRKLAPLVSPGKTWEGLLGGALMSLAITLAMLAPMGALSVWWPPVIVLLVTVSVFGDLFESVLKRKRGVKDSGSLLPGHGGMLDRIDSLVAVLPVFALVLSTAVSLGALG